MNIPQVLGYARIAGTPVVTGLYTVLLPLVAFAVFGSSRHLVVAADFGHGGHLLQLALPHGDARERAIHGAGRHGGAADRRASCCWRGSSSWAFSPISSRARCWSDSSPASGFRSASRCWATCSVSPVHSHRTLVQALGGPQGLPQPNLPTLALSGVVAGGILLGNRFAPRLPLSLIAVVGTIAASAAFHFAETRHRGHRSGPRWAAVDRAAGRDLERDPGAAAGGRFMLRDDHRAKRGDSAGIRLALSRARRRGCATSSACRRRMRPRR